MALDLNNVNSQAKDAYSSGQNSINSFDPTSKQQNWLGNYNSMLSGQDDRAKGYMSQYSDTIAKNPQMQDAYTQANEQYGVPALRQQANRLTQQVNNQVPQQYQLARGFDVSDAQVQNAANVANRFLMPQATAAQQNANTAQELAQGYVTQQQAQNTQNLLPIQAYGQFLGQNMTAQQQGWTDANNNEITGLIAKMQAGISLTSAEMQRLQSLAAQEEAYQQAQLQGSQQMQQIAQNQKYITTGPGSALVNTFTNQIMNPGTLAGASGYYGR